MMNLQMGDPQRSWMFLKHEDIICFLLSLLCVLFLLLGMVFLIFLNPL